ncbi:MAG: cysteine--tRNA ligase [bacterium]
MAESGVFRGIKVYDDLAREKRDFIPLEGNKVRMYVCGVTVYDTCHLGHARAYVTFDVIRRYLEYRGYDVTHVQNFTDVDDKIIRRAREENVSEAEIAERYIRDYFEVMDALHVRRAAHYPRATDHVPDMIETIAALVGKGHAYAADGNVFFSVGSFPGYGRLSRAATDGDPGAQAPEETTEGKRDPHDFALWKAAKPGEPFWLSPWGEGRPGWHIECSVMAMKHLGGATLDIHGGGRDLLFPHHENEIAQSESATGRKFANFWVHNGFVQMNREKMSKSLGNIVSVRELLEKHSPDAIRLMLLKAHYRMPLNFSLESLEDAREGLERFRAFFDAYDAILNCRQEFKPGAHPEKCEYEPGRQSIDVAMSDAEDGFVGAMNDDFNTPEALAALYGLVRAGNAFAADVTASARGACCELIRTTLRQVKNRVIELGNVLGLFEEDTAARFDGCRRLMEDLIEAFISVRRFAREKKDWETADRIRGELERLGVIVEDRPAGASWRLRR